jgi:hypothetical protein
MLLLFVLLFGVLCKVDNVKHKHTKHPASHITAVAENDFIGSSLFFSAAPLWASVIGLGLQALTNYLVSEHH